MVFGFFMKEKFAGKHREIHDVEQTNKLILCVNIYDFDFGVQNDSFKRPIQHNFVGSGHVSHRRTSALHVNFCHSFIIFKNAQLTFELTRTYVCDNVIHV